MKKITLLMVLFCVSLMSTLYAQQLTIPYQFGFEDSQSAEMQNWHFNEPLNFAATDSTSRWVVGTAVKNEGKKSLYISCDANGSNAEFRTGTQVMYAYRDFQVPPGNYILSFDWKCFGTSSSYLSACVGIPGQLPATSTTASSVMSTGEYNTCKGNNGMLRQRGQNSWQNQRFNFRMGTNSPTLRLLFVWEMNNNDLTLVNRLGACIDNIQIASSNCQPPTQVEVQASCDTTYVNWTGYSSSYIVEYRKVGDTKWHSRSGLTTTNTFFEGLSEGAYDFRVRGVCGADSSVYTYKNGVTLFCENEHCINFVNFNDPNVHCFYGDFDNPEETAGVVDYGSESMQSRHTVNWEQNVYDPRTGNQLPLVPPTEMATVRLGNWNDGAEAERIIYDYVVDSASAILLLKYACVLEDPPGHGNESDKFSLEIRDANNNRIDPTCGYEEFVADSRAVTDASTGWHTYRGNSATVYWKEWTTIGLDLSQFVGQQLRIVLTSYDCNWSAHFGYAYFTLGCASAKIQTVSCGSDTLSIQAPPGFTYEWRAVVDGVAVDPVLSTTAQFAAKDSIDYQCHLTQVGKSGCSFNLYSSVIPRFPYAGFEYTWSPKNCYNRVLFTNDSHILVKYDGDTVGTILSDPCDDYEWTFTADNGSWSEESSEKNPIVYFPEAGGDFTVSLKATIADGACYDVMTKKFHVPAIGVTKDTIHAVLCEGETYAFGEGEHMRIISESGYYGDTLTTFAGCDSIIVLDLVVNPVEHTTVTDTICYEDMLAMQASDKAAGHVSSIRTGNYLQRFLLTQVTGCDSIVTQPFYPAYTGFVDTLQNEDGTIDFIVNTSVIKRYTWQYYSEIPHIVNVAADVMSDTLRGQIRGTYTFSYSASQCDTVIQMCNDWLYQRWDDVISLYSAEALKAKGRDTSLYAFNNFQWYKNDVAIEGATKSYYYEPNGLDPTAVYVLRMTRLSDGEQVETCDFTPEAYRPNGAAPRLSSQVANSGSNIMLTAPQDADCALYSVDGMLLSRTSVSAGNTSLQMPTTAGIYILHVVDSDKDHSFTIQIK